LILDLRGFTKGTIYRLAPYLTDKKVTVTESKTPFLLPSLLMDNLEPTYNISKQISRPSLPSTQQYKGFIVALIDSSTISHGEHSCIYLKACRPEVVFIGRTTNGAIANVTNIILPGGVLVGFSGMGYQHPGGKNIQRCGIIPDIMVEENFTSKDVKDIILSEAISYLSHKNT